MAGFSEGVRPGGLFDSRGIEILVCYILAGIPEPLSREAVTSVLIEDEMANLFEISAAIDDLIDHGNLIEGEGGDLLITDGGRSVAAQLFDRVPYTLRERSVKTAMRMLARARNERDADVTVTPAEKGFVVKCSVDRSDTPMMSFSLLVPDETQAAMVRERFLDDPSAFYRAIIALSTGDFLSDDSRLIIEKR